MFRLYQDKSPRSPDLVTLSTPACAPLSFINPFYHRYHPAVVNTMAEEKQIQENTTNEPSSLSHYQTKDSAGLHHDHIAQEALGGRTADLGKSYYTSMNFIGTVIVRVYSSTMLNDCSYNIGHLLSPDLRIPWMGASSQHPHPHQRCHWTIARHHLGWYFMDCWICHWIHARRSLV